LHWSPEERIRRGRALNERETHVKSVMEDRYLDDGRLAGQITLETQDIIFMKG
jgi:hypothetical protein